MVQLADSVFRLAHRQLIWPSVGIWSRQCRIELAAFDGMTASLLSVMLGRGDAIAPGWSTNR